MLTLNVISMEQEIPLMVFNMDVAVTPDAKETIGKMNFKHHKLGCLIPEAFPDTERNVLEVLYAYQRGATAKDSITIQNIVNMVRHIDEMAGDIYMYVFKFEGGIYAVS